MTAASPPLKLTRGATRTRWAVVAETGFALLLWAGTMIGVIFLALLAWEIVDNGWSRLMDDPIAFLTNFGSRRAARAGIKAALWGSIALMGLVTLLSFPIGVGCAVYLEMFAPKTASHRSSTPTSPIWPAFPLSSTGFSDSPSSCVLCPWGPASLRGA